eukprot:8995672-Lingulodinium_polyedra.AAC.1
MVETQTPPLLSKKPFLRHTKPPAQRQQLGFADRGAQRTDRADRSKDRETLNWTTVFSDDPRLNDPGHTHLDTIA